MDLLVSLHRKLQPVVDTLHLRPLAQILFRRLHSLRYRPDTLARATQNGREWWLVPEVALRGEYAEYETTLWLREVVKPGMTVIDVGANVGQMTLEMAHLVGPSGKVIAIEPAPGNVEILRKHVRKNGFGDRVTIIEAACSDIDGESVDLKIFGTAAGTVGSGHTIVSETSGAADACGIPTLFIRVPTVALDTLCERLSIHPGVIKIDVEGAELSVLKGAGHILAHDKPGVRFGFHPFAFANPAAGSDAIRKLLHAADYRIVGASDTTEFELEEYSAFPI